LIGKNRKILQGHGKVDSVLLTNQASIKKVITSSNFLNQMPNDQEVELIEKE
jgi:hypothetical protein